MIVSNIKLSNWRNFRSADVNLQQREFIVGANASGKSNFLDVFRFLRDIARIDGGGLQKAIKTRGGISKIRSLAARKDPEIIIDLTFSESAHEDLAPIWRYSLGIKQEPRGYRQPIVSFENVWKNNKQILKRPNSDDKKDKERLNQTYLEQVNSNEDFRDIVKFLNSITYLHLVPQLLRYADAIQGRVLEDDPYGQGFLIRVAKTTQKTQKSRLKKIEEALKIAVPQLQQLKIEKDQDTGHPHLAALYSHWRPNAGWQREDQFSDGTLRLIALLWSLLDGDSLLLLEEPELSLNSGIVSQLAPLIHRMTSPKKRQVLISTHSDALLEDKGIDGREVILLQPATEGSSIKIASDIRDIRLLLESGLSISESVLPRSKPSNASQLSLFK